MHVRRRATGPFANVFFQFRILSQAPAACKPPPKARFSIRRRVRDAPSLAIVLFPDARFANAGFVLRCGSSTSFVIGDELHRVFPAQDDGRV